ncbi:MAG TPA: DUF4426 domain-containing protein [Rhodanobacteraceae bacterium]|nr:DUF4426 domain-containing protein [Rhodanobacteraceae bacterium]
MRLAAVIGILLALLPFAARSDYDQDFGDVVVHYSALPTERLLPAMAKAYDIVRSRDRGLVNIAVERKGAGSTMMHAAVDGTAVSLSGETVALKFRELAESGTVSYIAEFPLKAPDTYRFTIAITPEHATVANTLKFSQDFVAD